MQAKNITIVVPGAQGGTGSTANDIAIQPGVIGRQVLEQLRLVGDYVLTKGDGTAIDMGVDLYPLVADHEKLYATTKADVGWPLAA